MKEITIRLSTDEVYCSLMDYLSTQPDVKVKRFLEPRLIEARLGQYLKEPTPCKVTMEITSKNKTTTHIKLDFDFTALFFLLTAIFIMCGAFFITLSMSLAPLSLFIIDVYVVLGIGLRVSATKTENKFVERIKTSLNQRAKLP